jgi:hypothetical protein
MPGRLSLSEFAFVRPVMSDLRQRLHVHQWRPAVRLDEEAVSRRERLSSAPCPPEIETSNLRHRGSTPSATTVSVKGRGGLLARIARTGTGDWTAANAGEETSGTGPSDMEVRWARFPGIYPRPARSSARVRSGSRFQHMPRQTAGYAGTIDAPAPVGRPIIHGRQRGRRRRLRPQGGIQAPSRSRQQSAT